MAVEVEDEFFKQAGEAVADEVAEVVVAAGLIREPVLVDELTEVEEKGVDAVVAVELNAAKVVGPEVYDLDWSEPAKDIIDVRGGFGSYGTMIVELEEGGFENPVWQR
jgi:hypothetical protein